MNIGQKEVAVFKYFAFIEECEHYTPFLAMRKSGPYDKQVYTKKDIESDKELAKEFYDCYYALIKSGSHDDKEPDTMFIGCNEDSEKQTPEDFTYDKKELTMKVLKKYGIDKLDKMALATAILKRHPVAMWLRPLLLKGE
jgi:hypothetical protein